MRQCNLDESPVGVKIGERNNLRHANDTTLLAESAKDLGYLVQRFKEESECMGLYLNIKKTKVMKAAGNGTVHITINNEETERDRKSTE